MTVSYTHLDVYKRQPVQYVLLDTPGIHKPRNRLDSRMTQTAAASLKDVDVTPVSYTHLDVYKRQVL